MDISIGSGALFNMSGIISNNATWNEQIFFIENGSGMELTGLAFQLQFRDDPMSQTTATLALTTADGDMTITNDTAGNPTILEINVPYTRISSLCGDYQADLVSKDADDKLTHWASGIVSFRQNPVAF